MKQKRKSSIFHLTTLLFLLVAISNAFSQSNEILQNQRTEVVKEYVTLLGKGNYQSISQLFTKNALVVSSSGIPDNPYNFYKKLFTKTITNPQANLINIFEGAIDQNMQTAYFNFSWQNVEERRVSAKFLDLFLFEEKTKKIKVLFVFSNTFQEDIMTQLKSCSIKHFKNTRQ